MLRRRSGQPAPVHDWRRDEAVNQTRFRDVNESISAMSDADGGGGEPGAFVCECSDAECSASIRLTRAEYEVIRSESTHFAIATDHENPEIDRVVTEYAAYSIVQKVTPQAARIARDTDPRRHAAALAGDVHARPWRGPSGPTEQE